MAQQYIHCEDGIYYVEAARLQTIAQIYGTPCYVYSGNAIIDNYKKWANSGSGQQQICYAVKANSNLAILNLLARQGSGFDIVSLGEYKRVLYAGGNPQKVIFSGVGKTHEDIEYTLKHGIGCFNVESESELELIADVATQLNCVAPVSIRVNPNIDAGTHPYISTGLKQNKFGIESEKAVQLYQTIQQHQHLLTTGIDCHIGSQLLSTQPLIDSLHALLTLLDQLQQLGIALKHIDLGGGIGVSYNDSEPSPNIAQYIQQVEHILAGRGLQLMFEPGRSIVASSGVLLTRVLHTKESSHNFAIVDAAMNDYLRPALYSAWNRIENISLIQTEQTKATKNWDIVGPICESADFLGKSRDIELSSLDLLCIFDVGAYGFSMSSQYNSRPKACEVLVMGENHHLIRQREAFDDIIRGEQLLP